jgi:hypothetical protein
MDAIKKMGRRGKEREVHITTTQNRMTADMVYLHTPIGILKK